MQNEFNKKYAALLKVIDPEIAAFYTDWRYIREFGEFETAAHLLAHLAREILRGLKDRVRKDVDKKIYNELIDRFDGFSHRRSGWKTPREKEKFEMVWPDFENLLLHLIESGHDSHRNTVRDPFSTLQDSLARLKTKLDKDPPNELLIPHIKLSASQSEINQNLETLAPLIAAFYRDWTRMRQSTNFDCRSYLLGHLSREIAGGFRDILAMKQEEGEIKTSLQSADLGNLKGHKDHIASIMSALGVADFDSRAEQWIETAKDLATLAHKNRDDKARVLRKESESIWPRFEELLAYLVGGYLNLLNRVDKIVRTEAPNEDMIQSLPSLLEPEVLYRHFFENLESPAWLIPLKDAGWFFPDRQPPPLEVPIWHALKYVEKVSDYTKEHPCDETFSILADIVNTIVDHTNNTPQSMPSDHTDWRIIKIICAFPIERIESRHLTFIGVALRSEMRATLVDSAIGEIVLPKLLNGGSKELTLTLFEDMLDAEVIHRDIRSVMEEYWLWDALQKHKQAIAELCGIEAVRIACARIQTLINEGAYSFNIISKIDSAPSDYPHRHYAELLVGFTSGLLRSVKFDNGVKKIVKDLLQEGLAVDCNDPLKREAQTIFGRIALTAVTHHYENLKQLFWEWQGNPLEETLLRPELYQLIQTNCRTFDESKIDQVLNWIESVQYMAFAEDPETLAKVSAYRKREWLSALMETGNEKVISAYEKYQLINPAALEHPGLLRWTEVGWGNTSPRTIEEMSGMSNAQIAEFLNNFKQEGIAGPSEPSAEGLRETLEEYVTIEPRKFADDFQPFYGVQLQYQCSLLQGFLKAWRDKKKFNWTALLEFIHYILASKQLETVEHTTELNYRDWILAATAELIKAGTMDDEHAFDVQLLPLAEKILLVLAEKVKSDNSAVSDVPITVLNSTPEKVFSVMVDYALRFARTNETENEIRWPQAIKADFTKRLDRSLESSFEFSFTLGAYLPNLMYLDKEWVVSNINRIFPQQDEYHWRAAFSGYLYNYQIYADLYSLLKELGHYQKALNTDFADREVPRGLVAHICTGWIEGSETLEDKTSLIYGLINSTNSNLLSNLVHFFWRQRNNLPPKVKAKVIPTWRALYENFSEKDDVEKYREVLSRLSGWVALVDEIDAEVMEWLKMSTQYITGLSDSAFFVEDLLPHVTKTPAEVGEIYLGMLTHDIYPYHDQEQIHQIVRVLYSTGHKDIADRIGNLYCEAGFDFLKSLYDENQN